MRFDEHYFTESIKDWSSLVKTNPYWKAAQKVLKIIEEAGYEALIVGGAVRDLVLGKESDDIDISTNAPMDVLEDLFKTYEIGKNKDFGVVVAVVDGYDFEIAHYRVDVYDDEKGKGADSVQLTKTYKDDASRRDLTINQLGVDSKGNIVDHFGGLKDLENKIITTVGDPDLRFKEDHVRQLRSVRFASRFGFDISKETIDALKRNAPEIAKVSPERINKELKKMAQGTGEQFAKAIEILDDVGLLKYILPEIVEMKKFEHDPTHHPEKDKDGRHTVLAHIIDALKSQPLKNSAINLSVLFHDLGKIKTHVLDDNGIHRYFGHAKEADDLIDKIADRLKFDNQTRNKIKFAAINHMKFHDILNMNNSTIAKLMDSPYFEVLKSVALADAKSRGQLFSQKEWDAIENKILKLKERFKDRKVIESIRKIVNGKMVMSLRSDIKPGPKLGDVIQSAVDFVLNNNIDLEKDLNKVKQFIQNVKV